MAGPKHLRRGHQRREAFALIESEKPAVVFSIIRMTGLNGLQVAERTRRTDTRARLCSSRAR